MDVAAQAGVSRSVISKFETRQINAEIGLDNLVAAYATECDVDWLALWRSAVAIAEQEQPSPRS